MFLIPSTADRFLRFGKKKCEENFEVKIDFFFFDTSKIGRRLRVPKEGGFVKKFKKLKISKPVRFKDYVLLTYI